MKYFRLTILLILTIANTVFSQKSDTTRISDKKTDLSVNRHGIYAELGGGAYTYSFGYSYKIVARPIYELQFSVGFSSMAFRKPTFSFGFPVSFNNRFKFLKFNGIDIGVSFSEFINAWAIKDQEKYFNCPNGSPCEPKISTFVTFYLGWVFRIKQFTIMPRFYVFPYFNNPYSNSHFIPWYGLRIAYTFKFSKI